MRYSHKLGYIATGGLLMLTGMMASGIFMPNLFAQRDRFGEIECTTLRVVDEEGNVKVLISGDEFGRYNNKDNEAVFIGADRFGGIVSVSSNYSNAYPFKRGGTIECNTIRVADTMGFAKVALSGYAYDEHAPTFLDNGTTFIGIHEGTGGGVVRVGGRVGGRRSGFIECTDIRVLDGEDNVKVVLGDSVFGELLLEDTGVVYIGTNGHGKGTVVTRDRYGDITNRIR